MQLKALVVASLVAMSACGGGDDDQPGDPDAGISTDMRPGKRSDFAGVVDEQSGTLAIFGGDDGPIVDQIPSPSYLSDTWIFDPTAGWTDVTGGPAPSTRGRHAVAYDPSGRRMLSFGGRFRTAGTTGNYTLFDDLWSFDFAARTWSQLDAGGSGPSPRYFAAAAYDPATSALFVYGGDTNPSALSISASNEVWRYSGSTWQPVTTTGTAPSARLFVGYAYDTQRNRLIVFGGQVGDFVTAAFNDTYALDLTTSQWTQLHDGAGTAPSGRFSSVMLYDSERDRYLMTGGHADRGVTNDVWAFDPTGNTWSLLVTGDTFTGNALGCLGNPREIPADYMNQDLSSPERRSGGVFKMIGGDVWLFGGESDCSDHLDDTWRLDPITATWTEVIEARSGESCARRNDACSCLCL